MKTSTELGADVVLVSGDKDTGTPWLTLDGDVSIGGGAGLRQGESRVGRSSFSIFQTNIYGGLKISHFLTPD